MEENIRVNDDEMAFVKPSNLAIQSSARHIGVISELSFPSAHLQQSLEPPEGISNTRALHVVRCTLSSRQDLDAEIPDAGVLKKFIPLTRRLCVLSDALLNIRKRN